MARFSEPEQDLGNPWGWIHYGALLFLAITSFTLVWILFMGLLKINGIEILQKDIFHFSIPFYGKIDVRWWQLETLALGGWIILFAILVWIKIR